MGALASRRGCCSGSAGSRMQKPRSQAWCGDQAEAGAWLRSALAVGFAPPPRIGMARIGSERTPESRQQRRASAANVATEPEEQTLREGERSVSGSGLPASVELSVWEPSRRRADLDQVRALVQQGEAVPGTVVPADLRERVQQCCRRRDYPCRFNAVGLPPQPALPGRGGSKVAAAFQTLQGIVTLHR